jgi:hypothetical protein
MVTPKIYSFNSFFSVIFSPENLTVNFILPERDLLSPNPLRARTRASHIFTKNKHYAVQKAGFRLYTGFT